MSMASQLKAHFSPALFPLEFLSQHIQGSFYIHSLQCAFQMRDRHYMERERQERFSPIYFPQCLFRPFVFLFTYNITPPSDKVLYYGVSKGYH